MSQAEIKKAKELIIRAKVYRAVAFVFAAAGFIVAVLLYQKLAHGRPENIMQNPVLIVILLLPFVPAAFLAMLSGSKRAKATKILKPLQSEYGKPEQEELGEQI